MGGGSRRASECEMVGGYALLAACVPSPCGGSHYTCPASIVKPANTLSDKFTRHALNISRERVSDVP